MECMIREWKIEDAPELAEMLNNKKYSTICAMDCHIHIQRVMRKNILRQCWRLIKRKLLPLQSLLMIRLLAA